MLERLEIRCAWCGEPGEIAADPSGGRHQRFVEDCWVCCRPNVIEIELDGDGDGPGGGDVVSVTVTAED